MCRRWMLQGREPQPGPRDRLRRLPAYATYLAAFPFAAALEYWWSFLLSGATVTIMARRID